MSFFLIFSSWLIKPVCKLYKKGKMDRFLIKLELRTQKRMWVKEHPQRQKKDRNCYKPIFRWIRGGLSNRWGIRKINYWHRKHSRLSTKWNIISFTSGRKRRQKSDEITLDKQNVLSKPPPKPPPKPAPLPPSMFFQCSGEIVESKISTSLL